MNMTGTLESLSRIFVGAQEICFLSLGSVAMATAMNVIVLRYTLNVYAPALSGLFVEVI